MRTETDSVVEKAKEFSPENKAYHLSLPEFHEGEQPVVRSLFKAFVENVSDVTFGNSTIAKFIQEGSLSVSDGVLRVSPSIQNDEAFTWWITTLISFTAKTMLSIEGLCANDRAAIYSNLCKLTPYLSRKNSDASASSKKFCTKCRLDNQGSNRKPGSIRSDSSNSNSERKKCPGLQCPMRKKMQCEYEAQARILQNYWQFIRQSIQRIMLADSSSEGKKINKEGRLVALTMGISALNKLDPHQLYKRLECISTEHVMRVKIALWDILVTPNKVPCLKRYYDMKPTANALAIAQAKYFIKSLLDDFSKFQDAVIEVSNYLAPLDEDYLKQFGVTWRIVNHHIFDKVIYQDELFTSFIPHMESVLQVQLTGEGKILFTQSEISEQHQKQFPELFSGLPELIKSFQLFHRLMLTSREMFRRAELLMQTFVKQQQFMHNRTKLEILEEDLDFFTQQRRMVRKFVCDPEPNKMDIDDEADEAEFVRRFKDFLDYRPKKCRSASDLKQDTVCKYCNYSHCWCDECSFYHMILCGLIDCGIEVVESDINDLKDIFSLGEECIAGNEMEKQRSSSSLDTKTKTVQNNFIESLESLPSSKQVNDKGKQHKCVTGSSPDITDILFKCDVVESKIAENLSGLLFSKFEYNILKNLAVKCNKDTSIGSSLFTLHEQTKDSQSVWDIGSFDCQHVCRCEIEESDDENCNCFKSHATSFPIKGLSKKHHDRSKIGNKRNSLYRRARSSTDNFDQRQLYVSEDKKSVVHVEKKGICVTQITKALSRGVFISKGAKELCVDSLSDDTDESSDGDDVKVDIQRISENIVREIEKSLANGADSVDGTSADDKMGKGGASNLSNKEDFSSFSSFFGSGCRKLIESLMKKTADSNSSNGRAAAVFEEDTDESLSIDSSIDRCSYGHDHHSSCQGIGEDPRERYSRCDCCYCTYMANDLPSRNDGRRNEEVRERLRKILKQREEKSGNRVGSSVGSETRSCADEKDLSKKEIVEERSVDELLQFINEKKSSDSQLPPAKAAKKARQKQRKMDEKLKKAEKERIRKEKEQKEKEARLLEDNLRKQKEEEEAKLLLEAQNEEAKAKSKKRKKCAANDECDKNFKAEEKSVKPGARKLTVFVKDNSTTMKKEMKAEKSKTAQQAQKLANVQNGRMSSKLSSTEEQSDEKKVKEKKEKGDSQRTNAENVHHKKKTTDNERGSTGQADNPENGRNGIIKTQNIYGRTSKMCTTENVKTDYCAELCSNCFSAPQTPLTTSNIAESSDLSAYSDQCNGIINEEELQFLRQRAALIAQAAALAGTPLPPLDSLTADEQQKYFNWIKQQLSMSEQRQCAAAVVEPTTINTAEHSLSRHQISYGIASPVDQSSVNLAILFAKSRFGATIANSAPEAARDYLFPLLPTVIVGSGRETGGISEHQTSPIHDSNAASVEYRHLHNRPQSGRQTIPSHVKLPSNAVRNDVSAAASLPNTITTVNSDTIATNLSSTLFDAQSRTFSSSQPNPLASIPIGRYGAIGEKPPQRKTFNQYAAYDLETKTIVGLSKSPHLSASFGESTGIFNGLSSSSSTLYSRPIAAFDASAIDGSNSVFNHGSGSVETLKQRTLESLPGIGSTLFPALSQNQFGFDAKAVGADNMNVQVPQQHQILLPNRAAPINVGTRFVVESGDPTTHSSNKGMTPPFKGLLLTTEKKINLEASSSVWQNDDDARRFVESEECAVFKFSDS